MNRRPNWDVWLVRFAEASQGKPFKWGKTDCASLVRRSLITILGQDPWKNHLGQWKTSKGALRIMKRTKPDVALEASGAVEVGALFATSGDVAVGQAVGRDGLLQMGVVLPSGKLLTSSQDKGVYIAQGVRFADDTRFWRYG